MTDLATSKLPKKQQDSLKSLLKNGPDELHRAIGLFLTALKFPDSSETGDSEIRAAETFAESVREALVSAAMKDPESEFSWAFTPIYGEFVDALDGGAGMIAAVMALIDAILKASEDLSA